jgi:hypothetical protein
MYFLEVNVLALLVAAVIQWVLGWLWFGVLFKKDWTSLVPKQGGASSSPAGVMALIFITNIILSFALVKVLAILPGGMTWVRGSLVGAICGLGFVVPPMFAQHISEQRPFKLFGINALYWLIAMYLAGGVLAIWR